MYRIVGGVKIWQIANFLWLVNFNLTNWWPFFIEYENSKGKWLVQFWRMVKKSSNRPELTPSKITHYIYCTTHCVTYDVDFEGSGSERLQNDSKLNDSFSQVMHLSVLLT